MADLPGLPSCARDAPVSEAEGRGGGGELVHFFVHTRDHPFTWAFCREHEKLIPHTTLLPYHSRAGFEKWIQWAEKKKAWQWKTTTLRKLEGLKTWKIVSFELKFREQRRKHRIGTIARVAAALTRRELRKGFNALAAHSRRCGRAASAFRRFIPVFRSERLKALALGLRTWSRAARAMASAEAATKKNRIVAAQALVRIVRASSKRQQAVALWRWSRYAGAQRERSLIIARLLALSDKFQARIKFAAIARWRRFSIHAGTEALIEDLRRTVEETRKSAKSERNYSRAKVAVTKLAGVAKVRAVRSMSKSLHWIRDACYKTDAAKSTAEIVALQGELSDTRVELNRERQWSAALKKELKSLEAHVEVIRKDQERDHMWSTTLSVELENIQAKMSKAEGLKKQDTKIAGARQMLVVMSKLRFKILFRALGKWRKQSFAARMSLMVSLRRVGGGAPIVRWEERSDGRARLQLSDSVAIRCRAMWCDAVRHAGKVVSSLQIHKNTSSTPHNSRGGASATRIPRSCSKRSAGTSRTLTPGSGRQRSCWES